MQALESANKPFYREARIFSLQSGKELDLFGVELHLQQARNSERRNSDSSYGVEQTTVLVVEMKHFGELPAGFANEMAIRAYDYAAGRGVRMKDAQPKNCVTGVALPVKEMP